MDTVFQYLGDWGPTGLLAFLILLLLLGKIQPEKAYTEKYEILQSRLSDQQATHDKRYADAHRIFDQRLTELKTTYEDQFAFIKQTHADQLQSVIDRLEEWKAAYQQISVLVAPEVVEQIERLTVLAETTVQVLDSIKKVAEANAEVT